MVTAKQSKPKPTLNLDHQRAIAKDLWDLSNQVFEGTHQAETEFTRKDYVFFGLADKARVTFEAIQVLCDKSLIDDAFCLVRTLIEGIINGAYVAHKGDEIANDYAEFPDYWSWIEFTQLREVAPETTDQTSQKEVEEMQRKHDAVKGRYIKFKRGEWCADNLFQRALALDTAASRDFNLMRALVNLAWRKASVYVHGTASSIVSRVQETDSGIAIKRTYTSEESAGVLFMANMAMFALVALVDMRLGKHNKDTWGQLYDRWAGNEA
jgi:hypothetical protein